MMNSRCPFHNFSAQQIFHMNYHAQNDSTSDVIPAVFAKSWHKCYHPDHLLLEVEITSKEFCLPYPPAKWSNIQERARGVDQDCVRNNGTRSIIPGEGRHTVYWKCSLPSFLCPIRRIDERTSNKLASLCSISALELEVELKQYTSRNVLHSTCICLNSSAFSCPGNQFLRQPAACHTGCQNFTVLGELDTFRKEMRTAAAWILFRASTTSCYKEVGDKVWYFRKNCTRDNIFAFALSEAGWVNTLFRWYCHFQALTSTPYLAALDPLISHACLRIALFWIQLTWLTYCVWMKSSRENQNVPRTQCVSLSMYVRGTLAQF